MADGQAEKTQEESRENQKERTNTDKKQLDEAKTADTTTSEGPIGESRAMDTYEVLTDSDLSSLGEWEGLQETCLSEIPPIDSGVLQDLETKAKEVSQNLDLMLGTLSNSMRAMTVVTGHHMDAYDSCIGHIGKSADSSINSMCSLIALCEQVDSSMVPIHKMAAQIKEIKRTLDNFEAVCK